MKKSLLAQRLGGERTRAVARLVAIGQLTPLPNPQAGEGTKGVSLFRAGGADPIDRNHPRCPHHVENTSRGVDVAIEPTVRGLVPIIPASADGDELKSKRNAPGRGPYNRRGRVLGS